MMCRAGFEASRAKSETNTKGLVLDKAAEGTGSSKSRISCICVLSVFHVLVLDFPASMRVFLTDRKKVQVIG